MNRKINSIPIVRIKTGEQDRRTIMEKHIMGENGISYTLGEDGLYYPDLYLPEETEYPIGKYGMLRKSYLQEHRKGLYLELVLAGKLNEHLHQIDKECNQMMDRLVEQMKEKQGVTEELKMQDQMAWVGRMNNIDPDIFDMLEMSNKTSEEVFSLLDNLLKWTKSQLGKLTVIPQKLDISGLADGVVEVMNSVAEVKHIKLIRTDHESFFVYVDIEMIKSILRNLISNAVKFSNPDSEIKVGIKAEDGKVIVSVTDSGKGIKKEDQHKLLKDSTHFTTYGTNSEEGSGLGLLLCRDFARKNGGELWFESEENLGSVFSFSLPQLIA